MNPIMIIFIPVKYSIFKIFLFKICMTASLLHKTLLFMFSLTKINCFVVTDSIFYSYSIINISNLSHKYNFAQLTYTLNLVYTP